VTGPDGPSAPGSAPAPGPVPAPEVVYLDVEDEITSAAARIRRLEAARLAFVLPYGSRLATSRINFRLLAREAAARGKHLEIVAADSSARALAGSAGLVVYPSVAALESGEPSVPGADSANGGGGEGRASKAAAAAATLTGGTFKVSGEDATATRVIPVPRTPEPVPRVGRDRPIIRTRTAIVAGVLIALLVGGGALGAYLYLPSATIVLIPTAEAIGPLHLTVQARTDVTAPDPASLTVPAQSFTFNASATETFTTTGKKVAETKASGDVTFRNIDPFGKKFIRAGSVVSTKDGVGFVTEGDVSLPKAQLKVVGGQLVVVPSTSSVAVTAEMSGTSGNVAAGTIVNVPSDQDAASLKVSNSQPTSGGTHEESPQVSQQDVDAAMAQLTTLLRDDFDTKVRQGTGLPQGTVVFPETEALGAATPSVDPATLVNQEVATFDLGLTATGTVLGVNPAPVTSIAEQQLGGQVGDGWQLAAGSTRIDVGQPTAAGDVISFPVTATATRTRVVDRQAVLTQIEGLVLAEARARLEAYGQVQITLWPDWVSSIPSNPDRISLTVGAPQPAPSPSP
jgi:Baseplate J-like protein